ncbi:MAG: ANL family adenylate-forming protein [Opitutaceae bacterium]
MDWIESQLTQFGEQVVCIDTAGHRSYGQFLSTIDRYAELVQPCVGDRPAVIAVQLENTLDAIAALLAIARLQQVVLPLAIELPMAEKQEQLRIAGASFCLDGGGVHVIEHPTPAPSLIDVLVERAHAGLILFSSGTSGEPKGMLHDLDALLARYQTVKPRSDRTVQLLLADHIGGLDSAFRTIFSGSTLVLPERRSPDVVAQSIQSSKANILPASPTFLNLMRMANAFERYDCSSLELIAYGAEPMSPVLLEQLAKSLPEVSFQQKFGTSETGAIRIKSRSSDSLYFEIQDRDVEWQIVEGELWLKTSSRILGYLNADEASLEADGWYRTGDLVERSEDGLLRIIGRQSQVINVGGQKVHPTEVEQVIAEIDGVLACSVFGKSAPITGDMVACSIVVEDAGELREWKRRIRNHCRGRLAAWKIPASVELSAELSITDRLKKGA